MAFYMTESGCRSCKSRKLKKKNMLCISNFIEGDWCLLCDALVNRHELYQHFSSVGHFSKLLEQDDKMNERFIYLANKEVKHCYDSR